MTRDFDCYVALGDSFTCGTDPGREARWPDELARALGVRRYANLATVGATSRDVEERQLGRALSFEPDLVSLICGANDVLESVRPDPDDYSARLSRMLGLLLRRLPRAVVVTATYPDLSQFADLRERTRARVRRGMHEVGEACRDVARSHGVLCLEGWEHPITGERGNYAPDGFHPSREGHRRAAAEFLRALQLESTVEEVA
jgi:lysophospholipase L1-like esterase